MDVRKVLLIEGSINLVVMLSKLAIGLMTNSAAIIADAIHSLGDISNNIIAWFAVKISESPPDENHHYGHQKFEQIAVFFLASLLCVIGFEVISHAFSRFGQAVEQSYLGLGILLLTLVINITLTLWQRKWAKRLHSQILSADASHTFSDALTTIVVIAGWQFAAHGYYWLDSVFAVIVAFMIFFIAFRLFSRAVPILVDYNDIESEKLITAVSKIADVERVNSARVRRNSQGRIADITVTVSPEISVLETQLIRQNIEVLLREEFAIEDVMVMFYANT